MMARTFFPQDSEDDDSDHNKRVRERTRNLNEKMETEVTWWRLLYD